jgi:hypothetical protein
VAPPDHHMLLELGRVRLNRGPKVHHTRPAADPLFISAAEIYGECVIGIVLSGGDGDGTEGLRSIKDHGGEALVQHPEHAAIPSMPKAAILMDHPDACRRDCQTGEVLQMSLFSKYIPGAPSGAAKASCLGRGGVGASRAFVRLGRCGPFAHETPLPEQGRGGNLMPRPFIRSAQGSRPATISRGMLRSYHETHAWTLPPVSSYALACATDGGLR